MAPAPLALHPSDDEVYPAGTVVWWKYKGYWARITRPVFRMENRIFSHYEGEIEGREGTTYCLLHGDLQLECFPVGHPEFGREYLRL